ncbi:SapC family protein [Alphaproteobacteria bacterium]|jgi:hypothetical protein|nr:SapC family protein [Alphaproteobacteria bacterium]
MSNTVALSKIDHKQLRIITDKGAEYGDSVSTCITFPLEFRNIQHFYPIFFHLAEDGEEFRAVTLMGLESGENLFLQDNKWDCRYIPLSLDIQPFIIGRTDETSEEGKVFINLDSPRVSKSDTTGVSVFDENGMETPFAQSVVKKLEMLHAGYQGTRAYVDWLKKHELLEPFVLEVELKDKSKNRLVGFHTINEDKVKALDAATLGEMSELGYLMPTFMVLASLASVADLIDRKNRTL